MDINLLREAVTVTSFATFIGIIIYAVHPANRKRFDEAARVPLDDEIPPPFGGGRGRVGDSPSPKGEGAGGRVADSPSPQPSPKGEGANVGHGFANRRHP